MAKPTDVYIGVDDDGVLVFKGQRYIFDEEHGFGVKVKTSLVKEKYKDQACDIDEENPELTVIYLDYLLDADTDDNYLLDKDFCAEALGIDPKDVVEWG